MTESVINRYMLGERIGSGGMGDVFRGVDRRLQTEVAIKILKPELATPDMVQRFIREGETLRQLNHPNIVKLLDAVHENGQYYLIMELVEGGSLDDLLKRTPRLPIERILNIALDLADALTRAHRLNVIHRDIKPANVLLASDGMLRLTDFGIARRIGADITEVGSVLGTIAYIAPEVLQGKQADARSDVWSMGLLLFEMLAGEHPLKLEHEPGGLIHAILNATFPDLERLRPDVPTALIDLINRMVMKDPAERIPRMRLVGSELEAILASDLSTSPVEVEATQLIIASEPRSRFETPSATPEVVRSNLPVQTTPFVGREAELSELENTLRDSSIRLLTIVGPGGMGKTRLSLEVAGKFLRATGSDALFEHGVYFIDLAPVVSAEHINGAVAEAVGYAFQQDGRDAKQQLLDYLHGKSMLLLMDNFEHLMTGRTVVQDILQGAPAVKVVVTSREKLNLNAESVYILSGMSFPTWETPADAVEYGAVKLFLQSAQRVRRDFQLDADSLTYVARICRAVQGTPLGILLAASWLEALTPREIVDEISHNLDFLESEMHDLPERQRSLRAVFEYSWNLLSEPERMLFAQFSLFRGGFTRDAALAITGTNLRALTMLVNKSLLRRDNVSGRYEVHELLRQYAEEKFEQLADAEAAQQAYSKFYLSLLAQLVPKLKGFGQLDALNLIETDFENIRAGWTWAVKQGDAATLESAIEGMYLYLTIRNRFMDGEQLFGLARQVWRADGDDPSLLAGKLLARFPSGFPNGQPLPHYQRALEIAERHDDTLEIAFCQRLVGRWLSHREFRQGEGIPLLEASQRGYQALGEKYYAAHALDDLGWSLALNFDPERQRPVVQQSLDLRREIGDKIGIGNSLRNLGGASGGYFDATGRAFAYWGEAKTIAYEMNDRLNVAWNASLQAMNQLCSGEFERVDALLDEGYPYAVEMNDPVVTSFITLQRAALAGLRDEDYMQARRLIEEGLPPGAPNDLNTTVLGLAGTAVGCGLGDFQWLQPYAGFLVNMGPMARFLWSQPVLLCCLPGLMQQGNDIRAAELLHAFFHTSAPAMIYGIQAAPNAWARRWGWLNRVAAELEAKLGTDAYHAAEVRGRALPLEELEREVEDFLASVFRQDSDSK